MRIAAKKSSIVPLVVFLFPFLSCFAAITAFLSSAAANEPLSAEESPRVMAKPFVGFERGMGIGGWLTNYKRFHVLRQQWRGPLTIGDYEHFATYITEDDVKNIASMGMDHIRVCFDQVVLFDEEGNFRDQVLSHLDNFMDWCRGARLNVVLNLHKAIGNYCDIEEKVKLLDDAGLQEGFVKLWVALENHYADRPEIAFELLNEVRGGDSDKWNNLAERTIDAIRALDKDRIIVVGSAGWNSPAELKNLRLYDDEKIVYTFHIYAPGEFTHQRGVLQEGPLYYNRQMAWPSDIEPYRDYKRVVEGAANPYPNFERMDREFLRSRLQPAFDFIEEHPDKVLWCGEFGTIRHCKIEWRENWMNDVISLLKEYGISYSVWNYLSTPNDGNRFSLVDDDTRQILSPRMLRIIRGEEP